MLGEFRQLKPDEPYIMKFITIGNNFENSLLFRSFAHSTKSIQST